MTGRYATSPAMGRWFGVFALLLGPLLLGGAVHADSDDTADISVPAVFDKTLPESISDLQAIQRHVKTLLKRTMAATVGVQVGGAQGSGVIVNREGFVLTAGHVSSAKATDHKCKIIMPDGRILNAKTLGANTGIDSGMIQITDEGVYPFCEMAKSADLKAGDWCLAIGHPGGYQKGRSPVVRLGRVQRSEKTFIQTDCTLVGGDSGGPLFNMQGKVIGIHSRIGNLITANMHVPVDTYRDTWDRLAKGEEWGGSLFGSRKNSDAYLGMSLDSERPDCLVTKVNADSPAEKAGLRVNDIVRRFDGKRLTSQNELVNLLQSKRPALKSSWKWPAEKTTSSCA